MKFLANEKLTLQTSLDEAEILRSLNDAIEPIHPTEPIVVGLKPYVGMVNESTFEAKKCVSFMRTYLHIEIKGSLDPNPDGTMISLEIKKKTGGLVLLLIFSVLGLVMILFLLFPAILEKSKAMEILFPFFALALVPFTTIIVFLKAEHAEKRAKQFFLELLQAHEVPNAN